MNWNCEQTEARLSDYLDGLLHPAEQAAFDLHVNTCARCTPLVAGVSSVLGTLHTLAQVEPRPQLFDSILTATLGPQSWRRAERCFGFRATTTLPAGVTYGNAVEFPGASQHTPGYLLGGPISVPQASTLTHLGVIAKSGGPHVILALYSDTAGEPAVM